MLYDMYDIWCINLRERTDRRKKMETLFRELGILDRIRFHTVERDPRGSIAGCFQAHYECLVRTTRPYTIVFEDDCDLDCIQFLPPKLREVFVKQLWKTALIDIQRTFESNPSIDFFSVGCIPLRSTKVIYSQPLEIIQGSFVTALCYAIRQDAIQKILPDMKRNIGKVHVDYYYWANLKQSGYSMPLFIQHFEDSNNQWVSSKSVDKVARKVASQLRTSRWSKWLCTVQFHLTSFLTYWF